MYLALRQAAIPAELHLYGNTTHDFGVRPSERPFGQWTDACARWLRDLQFLPAAK
jgi:acetyl esterase/lipase